MVELQQKSTTNGAVGEAVWVSAMRSAGLSDEEIDRVVTATATLDRPTDNGDGDGRELVPVKEAAARIGRSENTVRSWIRLGHLHTVDRPPPTEHANGPWVLVDMANAEELDRRSDPENGHGSLITIRQAADMFDTTVRRIQGWHARGYLRAHGHRKIRGVQAILVDADEVAALISNPPRPGPTKSPS